MRPSGLGPYLGNGAGLCERGNYVKDMPGWTRRSLTGPDGRRRIEITTPTEHRYAATTPAALGSEGLANPQVR